MVAGFGGDADGALLVGLLEEAVGEVVGDGVVRLGGLRLCRYDRSSVGRLFDMLKPVLEPFPVLHNRVELVLLGKQPIPMKPLFPTLITCILLGIIIPHLTLHTLPPFD